MKVIVIHGGGQITQMDLENILQLDAQIDTLRMTRDRIAAGVIHRIAGGIEVEPGARSCRLDDTYHGKMRHQRLIVK